MRTVYKMMAMPSYIPPFCLVKLPKFQQNDGPRYPGYVIAAAASASGGAYMIKRNTSLTRVEGLAEQLDQPSFARRRSPLVKTPNGVNDNSITARTDLLPPGFRSPPGSPRR